MLVKALTSFSGEYNMQMNEIKELPDEAALAFIRIGFAEKAEKDVNANADTGRNRSGGKKSREN